MNKTALIIGLISVLAGYLVSSGCVNAGNTVPVSQTDAIAGGEPVNGLQLTIWPGRITCRLSDEHPEYPEPGDNPTNPIIIHCRLRNVGRENIWLPKVEEGRYHCYYRVSGGEPGGIKITQGPWKEMEIPTLAGKDYIMLAPGQAVQFEEVTSRTLETSGDIAHSVTSRLVKTGIYTLTMHYSTKIYNGQGLGFQPWKDQAASNPIIVEVVNFR
ncbi:MAG: hypothetical protein V1701_07260 [Planctomycetota bacterium]